MASDPDLRHRPSTIAMVVWVIFCFIMWAWAIAGPLTVVMVTLSLTADPEWMGSMGATEREKWLNLQTAAFVGAIGIAFAYLRLRGYLRFGDRD